jgi:hypothetical protein
MGPVEDRSDIHRMNIEQSEVIHTAAVICATDPGCMIRRLAKLFPER